MAFFKFRKGGDEPLATPPQPESVEAMRRRARHRLIGAAVLVLAGLVGFPLLFDTQPRPIAMDIPIDIPDRETAQPLPTPVASAQPSSQSAPARETQPATASPPATAPDAGSQAPVEPAGTSGTDSPARAAASMPEPAAQPKPKVEPKPKPEPEPKAEAKPPAAPKPTADDGAKARALLEGNTPPAATGDRFIVQVGAYADAGKARETRQRVERTGLKTYTHVAETKDGPRIRVRVGPFTSRAEADKAAERIKKLDLPAAILTL